MNSRYTAVLAGMLAVAIAFGITLPLGFWLRPQLSGVSDTAFAVALVCTLAGIAVAAITALRRFLRPARRRVSPPGRRPDPNIVGPYELICNDFLRLLSDQDSPHPIAPLLRDWFGYEIEGLGPRTVVRAPDGNGVPLRTLHARIQGDRQKQRSLYGRAMDLWR